MNSKPVGNVCAFGAETMLRQLAALEKEITGVLESKNIEYIHRMRVATRRLREAFFLFESCLPTKKAPRWRNDIRQLTGALGAARDADVQIAMLSEFYHDLTTREYRPGVNRLRLRLRQQRARQQVKVEKALRSFMDNKTPVELSAFLQSKIPGDGEGLVFDRELYQLAHDSVFERVGEFLGFEEFLPNPESVTELHAMRIAGKKLRYTLEIFAPLYPKGLKPFLMVMRQVQEILGDIHDCDMWVTNLPKFMDDERRRVVKYYGRDAPFRLLSPGILYFMADRQVERARLHQVFQQKWQGWKEKEIWTSLQRTVALPVELARSVIQ